MRSGAYTAGHSSNPISRLCCTAASLETMLYDCVTWSPRACYYDALCRAHHSFLARCIGWRNNNRADHPISYLDTLIKTGSENTEATLRRRRILFARFLARMEDTRLGGGGGAEKEWIGCFLDELRVFGINAHQWTGRAKERRG